MDATRKRKNPTATDSPDSPLVISATPFLPVPETIPAAVGFWGPKGEYQSWSDRKDWANKHIATDRRQRLVACVMASRSLPIFETRRPGDIRPRTAIEVAERYAEGKATDEQRRAAYAAAYAAADAAYTYAADAAYTYAADAAYTYAADAAAERINQSRLLSLAVALPDWSPQWHSSTAVSLAQAIYWERAYDRIPILADALEESGCDHPWLLMAMRDEQMQSWYRGVWFLDKLRGVE